MNFSFDRPLDDHLVNSVAKRISERFHKPMADLYERDEVGPVIEIGDIFVTYSRGNSFSSNKDYNDDKFGVKIWVPMSRFKDKHMKDALTTIYGQKIVFAWKWYKLLVEDEKIFSSLLNILKSE